MRTLLLDVYNEEFKELDIQDDLDIYYRLLDCSTIDIVVRKIGDRIFDIVCDDEGLFHSPQKISAIDSAGNPVLVGNLLFLHHNDLGEMTELSEDDVKHLISNIHFVFTNNYPDGYLAVYNVGWR